MISPQGYSLGEEPKAKNPFWGEGEDQDVNRIYATATVDENVGTPSVQTTKSIDGHDITFGFNFKNIIGKNGVSPTVTVTDITGGHRVTITDETSTHTFDIMNGEKGNAGVSPDVSVREIVGGHIVTITDATGSESFTVMNGTQGEKGDNGDTPVITITATQDGEPVQVTKTGTDAAPNFNIALTGGGGSASGTIGWGTYGPEVAGNYPRSKKEEYKLVNPITVNASGSSSVYIMGSHEFNWSLTGDLPANMVVSTKYTGEMTPGTTPGYIPLIMPDVSSYLTPTITPQDEMTVDNISVSLTSSYVDTYDNSLYVNVVISFDAHYNGENLPGNANPNIKVNAGEWSFSTTYAYLEVLPEA